MNRGAWRTKVRGVVKSRTRLSDLKHTHTHTHHNMFIHSPVGSLDCFYCMTNMNKAAVNILAYEFWCTCSLITFEHIQRCGTVEVTGYACI